MAPREWPKRPWPDAVPLYATPRNPERDTLEPEVSDISRRLGFMPMPWNRDTWATQYEYTLVDDPRWGPVKRLWYREARIFVPRQSSKTTAALVRHVDRQVNGAERGWGDAPVSLFTMQHASEARKKMVKTWFPILKRSPFYIESDRENKGTPESAVRQFVLSNGKESVEWASDGRMETFPPSDKGGHGDTVDLVDIDEAFAMLDDRAESGSRPAMITRPSPQLVIESTAGTASSLYMLDKVNDGRALVESGEDSHVFYLEYAANPDAGDDIHDPEHWHRWMPALGYTQSLEALKIEHDNYMSSSDPDKGEAGWARAFCNLWTSTAARIIPAKAWAACRSLDGPDGVPLARIVGRKWMAVDASPSLTRDGTWAVITVSGYTEDGRILTDVIEHAPGLAWLPAAIGALTRKHAIESLRLDPKSPVAAVRPDIELEANTNIEITDAETMAAACGRLLQDIKDGRFVHVGQPMLDAAADGAAKRTLLDGFAFARRTSSSDICPLVATVQSHWDAVSNPTRGLITMAP